MGFGTFEGLLDVGCLSTALVIVKIYDREGDIHADVRF